MIVAARGIRVLLTAMDSGVSMDVRVPAVKALKHVAQRYSTF
jgi:hypothetical protein